MMDALQRLESHLAALRHKRDVCFRALVFSPEAFRTPAIDQLRRDRFDELTKQISGTLYAIALLRMNRQEAVETCAALHEIGHTHYQVQDGHIYITG